MTKTTFTEQLHDLWRTRPVRLPHKGPIAGVAAGIGYRYGIDPVLVRVAFVVSTIFGGAGIVLYLVSWLLFSRAGDPASAAESLFGKGRSSESQTKTIVLLVALAIALSTMGPVGIGLGGSGVISMALMLGGLWLLYQRAPLPPPLPAGAYGRAGAIPTTGQFGSSTTAFTVNPGNETSYGPYTRLPDHYEPEPTRPTEDKPTDAAPSATTVSSAEQDRPPSWDPLGVAPFAWDLPEPAAENAAAALAAPRRRRSRFTLVVIGLAIIAAAIAAAIATAGADWMTPGRIGAVALTVVALGLVVGAFLRRGYGLLVIAPPLLGFVVLASLVGPVRFDGGRQWTPANEAAIASSYSIEGGGGVLDLRSVQLTKDRTIDLHARLGGIEVRVPENMNVRTNCNLTQGGCPTGRLDGTGPVLTLDIEGRFAGVEVNRG